MLFDHGSVCPGLSPYARFSRRITRAGVASSVFVVRSREPLLLILFLCPLQILAESGQEKCASRSSKIMAHQGVRNDIEKIHGQAAMARVTAEQGSSNV